MVDGGGNNGDAPAQRREQETRGHEWHDEQQAQFEHRQALLQEERRNEEEGRAGAADPFGKQSVENVCRTGRAHGECAGHAVTNAREYGEDNKGAQAHVYAGRAEGASDGAWRSRRSKETQRADDGQRKGGR